MYDDLLSLLKAKRTKKDRIIVFSFINNLIKDFLFKNDVDILRFDLFEFSKLFGYKDEKRVSAEEILPLLKNSTEVLNEKNSKITAIDLPVSECYSGFSFSLDKVIKFYKESNADALVLDINDDVLELINKLSKIKIPVIISARNKVKSNNSEDLSLIHNKLLEAESMGSVLFILENFPSSFVQNLRNSVLIPVITNEKNSKSDGFYARFSSVFGLFSNETNQYLNLYDLIKDGINDCIVDNK